MRRLEKLPARLLAPRALAGVDEPDLLVLAGRCPAALAVFWKIWEVRGLILSEVDAPGVPAGEGAMLDMDEERSGALGRSASRAARRRRLVVPVDLDSPERAEHTTATLLPDSM